MITDNDIYFELNKNEKQPIGIGFGLDGVLVFDMPSYVDFYDLLKTSDSVINTTENYNMIDFIKNGIVVETLNTSEMLGSLICSNPDILEIYRHPNEEQAIKNKGVVTGYHYDEFGNFTKPDVFSSNRISPYDHKQTS
jgi:hypothetical protein